MESRRWALIETLGRRAEWSALALDQRTTQWKSMARAIPLGTAEIVEAAHDNAVRVDRKLPPTRSRKDGNYASAIPIIGPSGLVHGVQLWVGATPMDDAVRQATGFRYSSTNRFIEVVPELFPWLAPENMPDRKQWRLPDAFAVVDRFDRAMDLILLTLGPGEDLRWEGQVSVRVTGGEIRNMQIALRNGVDDNATAWAGLVHDITDIAPPEPAPLDTATLAALRNHDVRTHLALVDTEQIRIIRWITDPIPGIQWRGLVDNRATPHPEDLTRIFATVAGLGRQNRSSGHVQGIRLRRLGGGWTIVDGVGTLLPAPDRPVLMLIELTVTGTSDEPDC